MLVVKNLVHFLDIDECLTGNYTCDEGEDCYNKENGYECQCMPGFKREKDKCVGMYMILTLNATINLLYCHWYLRITPLGSNTSINPLLYYFN